MDPDDQLNELEEVRSYLRLFSYAVSHRRRQLLEEFGVLHAREAMRALYMDSLEEFVEDRGASRPFVNAHIHIPT